MTGPCALLTEEPVVEPCRPGCKHYMYCLSSKLVGGDLRSLRRHVSRAQRVSQGAPLVHCGQDCRSVFIIRAGWFKLITGDEQGNEQIESFRGPGELIGLVDLIAGKYSCDAVALVDSEVLQIPAAKAINVLGHEAQSESLAAMAWRVAKERKRVSARNQRDALSRSAAFLIDLWDNQQLHPDAERHLSLPMSRSDIANHLGMKLETLSRCLRRLQHDSLVAAKGRRIDILDADRLRLAGEGDSVTST